MQLRDMHVCICLSNVMCMSRNMVYALKEVSIRGDFRTTLEYLITLMETGDFEANQFDTGWLDKLIADKVKVIVLGCEQKEMGYGDWVCCWGMSVALSHSSLSARTQSLVSSVGLCASQTRPLGRDLQTTRPTWRGACINVFVRCLSVCVGTCII